MLEIQVGGVDGWPHQLAEHAVEVGGGQAARRQQTSFSLCNQGIHEVFAIGKRGETLTSWGRVPGFKACGSRTVPRKPMAKGQRPALVAGAGVALCNSGVTGTTPCNGGDAGATGTSRFSINVITGFSQLPVME